MGKLNNVWFQSTSVKKHIYPKANGKHVMIANPKQEKRKWK